MKEKKHEGKMIVDLEGRIKRCGDDFETALTLLGLAQ